MIDLHYLGTAINDMIGTDKYAVYVNTNANPSKTDTRTVVTMNVGRVPFAYTTEELDAESLLISLTFDLPVAQGGLNLITKEEALNDIHRCLLGWRNILVTQPTETPDVYDYYTVTGKFEQQPPSNPYVDGGRKTQQIVVNCTAWAQNVECKALVGNYVIVSIGDETREPVSLLKVSRASNTQIGMDNNLKLHTNNTLPEVHGISRSCSKTLTFLYLGKAIEDEFLKIAEGAAHDVNKLYDYKVTYPNFAISQKFKIISVSSQDSAGVYLQYTLNVQIVSEAEVT
jgi:hypothetical protein